MLRYVSSVRFGIFASLIMIVVGLWILHDLPA
jgi:hypothetical protein